MMMGLAPNYSMLGMRDGFLGGEKGAPPLLGMAIPGEEADERARVWAALWAAGEQVDGVVEGGVAGGQVIKRIKRLRAEQVRALEASFAEEAKLEPERKVELAEQLGLQPRQVAVWFQNRRARSKSKQLELDYATLSAHYHSLLAEAHRLKVQVAQLTSELEHAKKGTSKKDGVPLKCCLEEDLKDEIDSSKGFTHEKMTTTFIPHAQQSSPSCSDYSVILDSDNSISVNQKDANAYECNSIEGLDQYSCLPHGWSKENLLATHQGLATSANHVLMQSHDLVLEESPLTNNIGHGAMDWLWGLAT